MQHSKRLVLNQIEDSTGVPNEFTCKLMVFTEEKDDVVLLEWSAGEAFEADAEFDSTNDKSCVVFKQ